MRRSMIIAATLALGASLAGCKTHEELVVDVVCGALCPCLVDPIDQAECEAECPSDVNPAAVSDACFTCILEASDSCPELFACEDACPGL